MNNPGLNISGVILSAPLTATPKHAEIDSFKVFFANLVGNGLPEMILNPRLSPSKITSSPLYLRYLLTSRRLVPFVGSRQLAELVNFMLSFKYNAAQFKYPLLIHLGADDLTVNNEATKKFFEKVGSSEKRMFEYEGARHELMFEG